MIFVYTVTTKHYTEIPDAYKACNLHMMVSSSNPIEVSVRLRSHKMKFPLMLVVYIYIYVSKLNVTTGYFQSSSIKYMWISSN